MVDFIGPSAWANYKNIIRDAHDTFFQDIITWQKFEYGLDYNLEDNLDKTVSYIELKCLVRYNDFRVWEANRNTTSGEVDRENIAVLLNVRYLAELGLLDAELKLAINQALDRFILRGLVYKATGISHTAQAHQEPLLIQLNLTRDIYKTGNPL
jgi:hypothetical protein